MRLRQLRTTTLLAALVLAGCSEVAIDCDSFDTWEACPLEEGCGWGGTARGWRCVTPCESDEDCDGGRCDQVASGATTLEDVNPTFDACVE